MIPRLYQASSRILLASAHVYRDPRVTFSSSAVSFVRRRSLGERANPAALDGQSKETEDAVEENKSDEDQSKEEEELDRWLLAGEQKVNESQIRSHKDPYGHFRKSVAPSFREPSPRRWLGGDVVSTLSDTLVDTD